MVPRQRRSTQSHSVSTIDLPNPFGELRRLSAFYGREHEMQLFRDRLCYTQQNQRVVIVIYGPGGQGKTELCTAINTSLAKAHPLCVVDLKESRSSPLDSLYAIRLSLIKRGYFKRPLFDVAFHIYQQTFHPGIDIKRRYPELYLESSSFGGTSDFADLLLQLIAEGAPHIPFVSTVERYSRRLADHIGQHRTIRLRSELADIHTWSHDAWQYNLPALLARDISEIDAATPCPVVLFDHYEHLWDRNFDSGSLTTNVDRWIRIFCTCIKRGLCGIFSRERLDHWADMDPALRSDDLIQVELSNLSPRTSLRMLKAEGVADHSIRKHIVRQASGHPLFLRVQIETYHLIARAGKTPRVPDFGSGTRDVLSRFVDHLDPHDGQCLKILSIPSSIDGPLFEHLANKMPAAFFGLNYDSVAIYSFFQKRDNFIVMHTVMRNGLQALADLRTKNSVLAALVEFCLARLFSQADHGQLDRRYFRDAARYRLQYDESGFLEWILALPEEPLCDPDFYPEVAQAREIAAKRGLREAEVHCSWLLSFAQDPLKKYAHLERAFQLLEGADIPIERADAIRFRAAATLTTQYRFLTSLDHALTFAASIVALPGILERVPPLWLAVLHWCWAHCAYDRPGLEPYIDHLRAAVEAIPPEIARRAPIYYSRILYELLNALQLTGGYEEITRRAGEALRILSSVEGTVAPLHLYSGRVQSEIESLLGVGDATLADTSLLAELSRGSIPGRDAKRMIPQSPFDDGQTLEAAPVLAFTMNIGFVVNARGKLCLVYDNVFPVSMNEVHVRYDRVGRHILLCFSTGLVYEIDWKAPDEMHEYLLKVEKILIIRMWDKKPVEGYDCPLLICEPIPIPPSPDELRGIGPEPPVSTPRTDS